MAAGTSIEERLAIMAAMEAGESVQGCAQRLRLGESTVRKWRQRYREAGRAGLVTTMGRPARGALSSMGEAMQMRMRRMREAHPGWGAVTLRIEVERTRVADEPLPSVATIGRFLKAQGLTHTPEPQRELPATERTQAGAAHACWEMDARGYSAVADVGVVTLINLNDRYSHVRLLSYPCHLGAQRAMRHATTQDYQCALRLAFMHWGLPTTLQVDHESVFHDNKSRSPFPTRLHLWLLGIGVNLTFGRVRRPEDQGMTERSHQLWANQVLHGQTFADWQTLYHALEQRRAVLNEQLPCRSLDDQPPLVAFPEARHSGRAYVPEHEAQIFKQQRIYDYLAQGRWFRTVANNGTISLGGHAYSVGSVLQRQVLELRFNPETTKLVVQNLSGQIVTQLDLIGLTASDLMGDWQQYVRTPALQFPLPFTWPELQLLRLYEHASAIT